MEIDAWLEKIGLGEYAPKFRDNAVDLGVLPHLTAEDLKEIGVVAVGHRRILLDAIARLGEAVSEAANLPALAEPDAERRQVSVLFADLVGYTELSAELDPEDVHALLDSFFTLADQAVISHGGTVDKHIGDCVMGVFGAPVARGNDPERAVRAAIAIRNGTAGITDRNGRRIEVHVGVASGQVMAALGGGVPREYTVTGEAVNLASRLADKAKAGEVLVSAAVHAVVAGHFACDKAGSLELKGFSEPMTAWRVREPMRTGPERPRPFVGREAELRQFGAALEGCMLSRRGQTIYVRGDPGIGKSRLVEEFERLARDAGYAVYQGLVFDFGGDNGRAAIAGLIRDLLVPAFGLDDLSDVRNLDDRLAREEFEVTERAVILDFLDLDPPQPVQSVFEAMDNSARARHAGTAMTRLMERASLHWPLLIVVEDVHWADATTLDVIAQVAESVAGLPALLMATSRVDGDPTRSRWTPAGSLLTFDLAPLTRDDALVLAESYLDSAQAQVEACITRAAGNPLFLDQLLLHARTRAEDVVPDTVQSLVQARMDQLAVRDRRALQTAAVLGQSFGLDALRHLLDDPAFEPDTLVRRHLLRRQDERFIFTHALIRDAAYGTLVRERRRRLHRRAAELLQTEDPPLAAEHLAMAEDPAALRACLDSATVLVERFRYDRALALIDRGLAVTAGPAERIALNLLRGEALLQSGKADAAEAAYSDALDDAVSPVDRCRSWVGLASARRITDRIDQALKDVDQALEIARGEDLVELAARALALRGNLLFPIGDIGGCFRAHSQSLELARKAGSAELEANALSGLGDAEYMRGRLATAHARFSECVAMSNAHGLRRIEASNLPMQAITYFWNGDMRGTRELGLTAVEAARRIGNERAQMIAHHATYFACRHLESLDEAFDHASQSLDLARRLKAPRFEAEGLAFLAQIASDRGEIEIARKGFMEALAIGRATGMAYLGPIFLGGIAQVSETATERIAAVNEAEALLSAGSVCHNHLMFRREMIDVSLRNGDWAAARHHADALERYSSNEPTPAVGFVVARGRALAAHGEGAGDVHADLTRLAAEAETLGDLRALGAIREALGKDATAG